MVSTTMSPTQRSDPVDLFVNLSRYVCFKLHSGSAVAFQIIISHALKLNGTEESQFPINLVLEHRL